VQYGDNLERLNKKLVDLCRKNEETSMLIHSLMSSVDESITFEKCIYEAVSDGTTDSDIEEVKCKLPTYRKSAKDNLDELYSLLEQFNFDNASGYNMLWTSYFMNYYGDRQKDKFLFDKFEQQNINVRNYMLPVQNAYK
jgi:hypothetical protein